MGSEVIMIIATFVFSVLCGLLTIPTIIKFCKKERLYDTPNARKIHKEPIPRLGGICFLPTMLLALLLSVYVLGDQYQGKIPFSMWSVCFFISLLIIYVTGLVDDFVGLDAKLKLTMQIIAASLLPLCGLYINNLYGLFGIAEIPAWIGMPLTVFVIVLICNAMNLIDGIDGLSGGLGEIALAGFLFAFFEEGLYVYCLLIVGLMGVLLAFLQFNLLGKSENGTKIFMGDSGSLTLGFILAFLFVKLSSVNPAVIQTTSSRMPFAFSLLVVPTFDVVRVVIHRLRTHQPLFRADKHHIHHKLMRAGLTMHQTLVVILGMALGFILLNKILFPIFGFTFLFVFDIIAYTSFHIGLDIYMRSRWESARVK